jgi:hypothetical protein
MTATNSLSLQNRQVLGKATQGVTEVKVKANIHAQFQKVDRKAIRRVALILKQDGATLATGRAPTF